MPPFVNLDQDGVLYIDEDPPGDWDHPDTVKQLRQILAKAKLTCFPSLSKARQYWQRYGRAILPALVYNDAAKLQAALPVLLAKAKPPIPEQGPVLLKLVEAGLGDFLLSLTAVKSFMKLHPNTTLAVPRFLKGLFERAQFATTILAVQDLTPQIESTFNQVVEFQNHFKQKGRDFGRDRLVSYPTYGAVKQHMKSHLEYSFARLSKQFPIGEESYFMSLPPHQAKRPYCTIHTGAGFLKKCWPASYFLALIDHLHAYFPGLHINLLYGPNDPDISPDGQLYDKLYVSKISDTPLEDIASLIAGGLFHVGNDAGITHLAGVLKQPVVAIFGPSGPGSWSPIGPDCHLIWGKAGRCFRKCNYLVMKECEDQVCLTGISPEMVLSKVMNILHHLEPDAELSMLYLDPMAKLTITQDDVILEKEGDPNHYYLECSDVETASLIETLSAKRRLDLRDISLNETSVSLLGFLIEKEAAWVISCFWDA